MNRKETVSFIRPGVLLAAGLVFNIAGLGMLGAAAATYRINLQDAATLTDTAANVFRIDVACAEVTP